MIGGRLRFFGHDERGARMAEALLSKLRFSSFTEATLRLGLLAYGYGYGLACLVSLAMAIYFVNHRLRLLHYWTFVRQPFHDPVAQSPDAELDAA